MAPDATANSVCEIVGGRATFERLVREYYMGVAIDKCYCLNALEAPQLYDAGIWLHLGSAAHAILNTFEEQVELSCNLGS